MNDHLVIENAMETSMVDLAYALLKEKGEPVMYQDIMSQVASLKNYTAEEVEKYIAQLYTAINIDGRFTCVGRGLWGLKDWYPLDQTTESAVAANVKDDLLDTDEVFEEDTDVLEETSVEIDELDDLSEAVVSTRDDVGAVDEVDDEEDLEDDEEDEEDI